MKESIEMKSIFFKIDNRDEPVEITFKKNSIGMYKPVLKTSTKNYEIPLLLEYYHVEPVIEKINTVKKIKGTLGNIELLREVVAGACSLSMKRF